MQTFDSREILVSVIVPIYNVELYLVECIESILEQTYTNYEIILVNDGSTDSSGSICDKYEKQNNNIKVIHKKNGGLSSARNMGIEKAKGNYYVFIDSDDVVHKDYLNNMMKIAIKYNADIVACDFTTGEECFWEDVPKNIEVRKGKQVLEQMNNRDVLVTVAWNKLYKRYFFDDLNLRYKNGKIHEDMFLAPKLLDNCNIMAIINEKLYFYRNRSNSIMNSSFKTKHLDILEALEYRMEYFKNRNYMDLYFYEIESYSRKLIFLYDRIKRENNKFPREKKEILSRAKKLIEDKSIFKRFTLKNRIKLILLVYFSITI